MSSLTSFIPNNWPEIAILLWLLMIGVLILFIRHWIRYILIVPVALIILFVMGMMIVPLYPQGPNIEGFFRQRESVLFIFPTSTKQITSQIIVTNDEEKPTTLSTQQEMQYTIKDGSKVEIRFISQDTGDQTQCFLLLPEGTILQIYPQASLSISWRYPNLTLTSQQGKITAFSSKESNQSQIIMSGIIINETPNNNEENIISSFQGEKIGYITRQLGTLSSDTTVNQMSKIFLEILNKMFPSIYQKNLSNYNAFQKYMQNNVSTIDKTTDPNIQKDIINQTNRGLEETKIYKRRQQLF